MDKKWIITIIFGVIFIIATIFALVNSSMLLSEGFKQILGYEECGYMERPIVQEANQTEIKEQYCVNDQKRNIANSLAYLIISLPVAIIFYRKLKKDIK